ncbi:MAG: transglycosylase domain-containing protein [Gemmatimonadaceae bacterium]
MNTELDFSRTAMLRRAVAHRFRVLRERMDADPSLPASVWLRERWRSFSALALACALVWSANAWLGTCGYHGCPSVAELRAFRPAEGGRILDRAGEMLGRMTPIHRMNVRHDSIPQLVREAFIATEDRRFHEHDGVDFRSMGRAALRNIESLEVREGFSTITMQVARNAFVARRFEGRSLKRKLIELRLARVIEDALTKEQILELYLNVIYLGGGAYGVEAASHDLFGRSVRDVGLAEAAMLAALPKGPSAYTPRRDRERALRRRNLVLSLMVRDGYVTAERARNAAAKPIDLAEHDAEPATSDQSFALDAVRALVDSVLLARGLEVGDVTVRTTIDADAQRAAVRAVRRRADAIQRESRRWYGRPDEPVQGAMVAIDPRTGDVRALVGGSEYRRGGFNRAIDAHRQPGSAFKPFVYAAALAAGLTPASMVSDEPVEIIDDGKVWAPSNYEDSYGGSMTLRRALAVSSNVAAVRISRAVGESRVIAAARRNGITSPLEPLPSIALGALEVTPIELVTAYAPFANGGYRVRPRLVTSIEAPDGSVLWTKDAERSRAMDAREAYQITSMLRSAVDHGSGHAIRDLGVTAPVAGKTGTTNDGTDVWFVGYTPTIVAGFWFGYDTPDPIAGSASGGRLAAPAWAEFFARGWDERAAEGTWDAPAGMEMALIDAETGELAGEWCPVTEREWFKPGTAPVEHCRMHEDYFGDGWMDEIGGQISRALKRVFRF